MIADRIKRRRTCQSFAFLLVWALATWCQGLLSGDPARAEDRSGIRPEVLSMPAGPGSVEGLGTALEAAPHSGTSTYSIPIRVPPGAGGLEPTLALAYSSRAGNGDAGLNWSVPIPSVRRNSDRGLPWYDQTDTFVLRGLGGSGSAELVATPDGAYRYRIEGAFVRVRRLRDGSWEAHDRSGFRYVFGAEPAARVERGSRVFEWWLTQFEDTHGNRIRLRYRKENEEHPRLSEVVYNDFTPDVRNVVQLRWEERPDVLRSYLPTFGVRRGFRIAGIDVVHGRALVRRYVLSYEVEGGMSRLARVQLLGDDGETSAPSLEFTYATLNTDAMTVVNMTGGPTRPLGTTTELADVNADGIADVVVMDPDVDGGRHAWYANLDGRHWSSKMLFDESPAVWLSSSNVELADMDGDGGADIVARLTDAADGMRYYRGTEAGFARAGTVIRPNLERPLSDPSVRLVDLDRDGLTDWLRLDPTTGQVTVAYNEGGGIFTPLESIGVVDPDEVVAFGMGSGARAADMNGDGLTDLVTVGDGATRYYPARGFGYFDRPVRLAGSPALNETERLHLDIRDVTGDGLADLVEVGASRVRIWRNLSGAALEAPIVIRGTPERTATTVTRIADMNGNGSADILWLDPARIGVAWRYLDVLGSGSPGLLTRIDNGLGQVTTLEYGGIAAMRTWADNKGIDWQGRCPTGQMLLTLIETSNGLDPPTRTELRYAAPHFDTAQREFRGFRRAERRDVGDEVQPSLITEMTFDVGETDEARQGKLLSRRRLSDSGQLFDSERYEYETLDVGEADEGATLRFAYRSRQETHIHEGQGTPVIVESEWEYDRFGNQIGHASYGVVDAGQRGVGEDERIIIRTFAINTDVWILDRMASEIVTDLAGRRESETRTYYDGDAFRGLPLGQVTVGEPSRKESWLGEGEWRDDFARRYDEHGNVVEEIGARGGRRRVEYDPESHTFAVAEYVEVSNNRVLSWRAVPDRSHGRPVSLIGPNGDETRYEYDALKRLVAIAMPDDGEQPTRRFGYVLGAPMSFVEEATSLGGGRDIVIRRYVDGSGRARAMLQRSDDDRWVVQNASWYGPRGLPTEVSYPHRRASVAWERGIAGTAYHYDAVGRRVGETEVDGARRSTRYLQLVRLEYDENDNDGASPHFDTPTRYESDGLGRLRRVVERDGPREISTSYDYDARGNLTAFVDALGRRRTYTYDALSRRVRIDDPNAGAWTFGYSRGDDLIERRDPAGPIVRWEHDLAGRPLREVHRSSVSGPETTDTRWHYDEQVPEHTGELANVAGQLAWVKDAAGEVYFGYDLRGRPTRRLRKWADGGIDGTWTDYNPAGLATVRGFPDGSFLEMHYDARGMLSSLAPIVRELRWTPWNTLDTVFYGNGIVDTHSYDARLRRVRLSASSRGTQLRVLRYVYDAASRIKQRVDERPDVSAEQHWSAAYTFDDRYRLRREIASIAETRWDYDDVGNLLGTVTEGVGGDGNVTTVEIPVGSDRISSVTVAGAMRLQSYDAAGRLTVDGDEVYTWNAEGRLASAESPGIGVESYIYGHDNQRVLKRVDGSLRVAYVDVDVERRGDALVRYVMIEGRRVARLGTPDHTPAPSAAADIGAAPVALAAATLIVLVGMLRDKIDLSGVTIAVSTLILIGSCAGGNERSQYPWLRPRRVTMLESEHAIFLHDLAGSLVVAADAAGEVATEPTYSAFGELRAGMIRGEDPGFGGKESDSSGRWNFHARSYRPSRTRFLSVDPIAVEDPVAARDAGMRGSPYAFAALDPVNREDSSGMFDELIDDRDVLITRDDPIPERWQSLSRREYDSAISFGLAASNNHGFRASGFEGSLAADRGSPQRGDVGFFEADFALARAEVRKPVGDWTVGVSKSTLSGRVATAAAGWVAEGSVLSVEGRVANSDFSLAVTGSLGNVGTAFRLDKYLRRVPGPLIGYDLVNEFEVGAGGVLAGAGVRASWVSDRFVREPQGPTPQP